MNTIPYPDKSLESRRCWYLMTRQGFTRADAVAIVQQEKEDGTLIERSQRMKQNRETLNRLHELARARGKAA